LLEAVSVTDWPAANTGLFCVSDTVHASRATLIVLEYSEFTDATYVWGPPLVGRTVAVQVARLEQVATVAPLV
jgi:hypothetical protein